MATTGLATSTTASETTTYTYNALGERTKKRNQNGLQTVFHYGNNGELLWEKDQAGNTKAYVWLDGRPLARIDNDATIYYYHVDRLGTPQAMTDAAGAVVWKADYEPFGKAAVRVSTIENNLRFPGQYFDRETGLHYNYFRDYDSSTGRYAEADPIGLAGGINLYAYANDSPLVYYDPYGLFGWSDMPLLPQGLVDYFSGYGSYYGGLGNAAVHLYRRSGMSGGCQQQRAIENEAALAAALLSMSNPTVASKATKAAKDWASNNKAFLGGRFSAGAVTSVVTGIGFYGGVSAATVAAMGDVLHNIDHTNAASAEQVLRSILGDRMPNLPRVC